MGRGGRLAILGLGIAAAACGQGSSSPAAAEPAPVEASGDGTSSASASASNGEGGDGGRGSKPAADRDPDGGTSRRTFRIDPDEADAATGGIIGTLNEQHSSGTSTSADAAVTPAVRGALSKDVIRRTIDRHQRELRYCYERELARKPKLRGQVRVKFVISPSGDVSSASVIDSSLDDQQVDTCVLEAVRRWVFPEPEGGGNVVVRYPFDFVQDEGSGSGQDD